MTDKSDIEALAFEGLDYFEKAGDEGDKAYVSAIRELLARRLQPARVPEGWSDAFAAFKGAFDTPAARRRDGSEYAEDARKRLREFNEAMLAAATQPEAAQACPHCKRDAASGCGDEVLAANTGAQPRCLRNEAAKVGCGKPIQLRYGSSFCGNERGASPDVCDECAAIGGGHVMRADGPNGERQCKHCGEPEAAQTAGEGGRCNAPKDGRTCYPECSCESALLCEYAPEPAPSARSRPAAARAVSDENQKNPKH